MAYQCHTCGETHDDLPDLGADAPLHWYTIPEDERATRARLTSDLCVIDGTDHFIRGVVLLPLLDSFDDKGRNAFGIGVWVSLAPKNFQTYVDHFDSADIGPFFGWLSTVIRGYSPTTEALKTMTHFRVGTLRPMIELEPTDHPLAVDQRNGITVARAWEIVHANM